MRYDNQELVADLKHVSGFLSELLSKSYIETAEWMKITAPSQITGSGNRVTHDDATDKTGWYYGIYSDLLTDCNVPPVYNTLMTSVCSF
jgi:hypothetical protein